ncbi:MAG: dUTP diphosphatase, partial [Dokdonella sp.]|nr:dUTP diphosphatase [Dokdonella sp.]
MKLKVEVRILDARIGSEFPLPARATEGSAGMDLRAMVEAPRVLEPGATDLVPSGIAIHIGDASVCAVVLPRSVLGHRHGKVHGKGTGQIDA